MRHRAIPLLCATLLLAPFTPFVPAAMAGPNAAQLWVESPQKTVYRTTTLPQSPSTSINLVAARGEYESAQIAVRAKERLRIERVRFGNLTADGNRRIAGANLSYHFVAYKDDSKVAANPFFPDREGNLLYPESAMPDPLSNDQATWVEAGQTQPVFVTGFVPRGTAPGTYRGTATVETTRGTYPVPIQFSVHNVEVPTIDKSPFTNYHWTMTNGFTWDGLSWNGAASQAYDVGKYYYGVDTYSDAWFRLMDEFARKLADYRTNMVWLRTDLFLQSTGTELSDFVKGIPSDIDWTNFDRYVETFKRHGITNFANQHLVHTLNKMPDNEKPNDSWNTKLPDSLPVTDAFLTNYLTALYKHLKSKGYTNGLTWYQHISDEPITADQRNLWTYVARKIKQINADLGADFRTMDADPDGILLDDRTKPYVDTWVPLTPAFERKKAGYKAQQAAGQDLWVYTCEVNTPPWLNRFWTQPTMTGRMLFWDLEREGVQGHLHWAWNAWYVGPWKGDSYIVYPDKANLTVKSSLRLEAQRDGLEDYELLYILKKRNPALAKQIVDSAISPEDPRRYTLDPAYLDALHSYIVRAAAGETVGAIPQPTSPYEGQDVPRTFLVDSTDDNIGYSAGWAPRQRQSAYLGSVHIGKTAGDKATYEFEGTGVDAFFEKNTTTGKVSVSVDGGPATVIDLYEAVQYDRFTAYRKTGLTPGKHRIEITNVENKEVRFDGFRVRLAPGQQHFDATLTDLKLTNVSEFTFEGHRGNYALLVNQGASTVGLTPTLTDAGGTITVDGSPVANGATVDLNVADGKNKVEIRTLASDGKTAKTYELTLVKGAVNTAEANIARGHSAVSASAARDGDGGVQYGPQKMVDGEYGTMFAAKQGYTDANPFPHEIVLDWNEPKAFNTLVVATRGGIPQGLTDIDVEVSANGTDWTTAARGVSFRWTHDDDDGVMEYSAADLPDLQGVRKLRLKINDANYTRWSMYAVYELELYNLPTVRSATSGQTG
ncbi:glycoside hydrolase domain-containing protein [Nonomuraea sp. NPDC052129]|uniref:glycoside hydrolase domain-containing protein n=1 Tax=Nonomuraea sp. NPDC052129 TaxID=3154651 RepID=UPI00342A316F